MRIPIPAIFVTLARIIVLCVAGLGMVLAVRIEPPEIGLLLAVPLGLAAFLVGRRGIWPGIRPGIRFWSGGRNPCTPETVVTDSRASEVLDAGGDGGDVPDTSGDIPHAPAGDMSHAPGDISRASGDVSPPLPKALCLLIGGFGLFALYHGVASWVLGTPTRWVTLLYLPMLPPLLWLSWCRFMGIQPPAWLRRATLFVCRRLAYGRYGYNVVFAARRTGLPDPYIPGFDAWLAGARATYDPGVLPGYVGMASAPRRRVAENPAAKDPAHTETRAEILADGRPINKDSGDTKHAIYSQAKGGSHAP